MGFQERHQIPRRAGQIVSAEELAVAGQDRTDARKIARGRDLGVFEREALIAERSVEYLLRQRQDLQKPHELGGEEAFAPASSRPPLGAPWWQITPEGGGADLAPDGAGFSEGRRACRRNRVLSLQEYVEKHVRIEQYRWGFAPPEGGFQGQAAPGRAACRASGSASGFAPAACSSTRAPNIFSTAGDRPTPGHLCHRSFGAGIHPPYHAFSNRSWLPPGVQRTVPQAASDWQFAQAGPSVMVSCITLRASVTSSPSSFSRPASSNCSRLSVASTYAMRQVDSMSARWPGDRTAGGASAMRPSAAASAPERANSPAGMPLPRGRPLDQCPFRIGEADGVRAARGGTALGLSVPRSGSFLIVAGHSGCSHEPAPGRQPARSVQESTAGRSGFERISSPLREGAGPPGEAPSRECRDWDCRANGDRGRGRTAAAESNRARIPAQCAAMRTGTGRYPSAGSARQGIPLAVTNPAVPGRMRSFRVAPGGRWLRWSPLAAPGYACLRISHPRSPLRSGVKTQAAPAAQRPKSCSYCNCPRSPHGPTSGAGHLISAALRCQPRMPSTRSGTSVTGVGRCIMSPRSWLRATECIARHLPNACVLVSASWMAGDSLRSPPVCRPCRPWSGPVRSGLRPGERLVEPVSVAPARDAPAQVCQVEGLALVVVSDPSHSGDLAGTDGARESAGSYEHSRTLMENPVPPSRVVRDRFPAPGRTGVDDADDAMAD